MSGCGRRSGCGWRSGCEYFPSVLRCVLKVLNQASRTLPRFPYTNLKKSRTEKKLVTEHA